MALAAPAVRAQDESLSRAEVQEYEERLVSGAERFRDGDYGGARRDLERAYEIFANPKILFSIASTYRRQGRDDDALRTYRRFLRECSSKECREQNREQLQIAENTITELEEAESDTDTDSTTELVSGDGDSDSDDGDDGEGEDDQEVAGDRGDGDRAAGPDRTWVWVGAGTLAVGVGALAFAGYDQLQAGKIESDIAAGLMATGGMWTEELAALEDDGKSRVRRARIFAVAGGVLAAAGTGLLIYGLTRPTEDDAAVSLAPVLEPGHAGLVIGGRF